MRLWKYAEMILVSLAVLVLLASLGQAQTNISVMTDASGNIKPSVSNPNAFFNAAYLDQIEFAQRFGVGTTTTCGLQEAHDALPSTGGTIVFAPSRSCTPTTRSFFTKNNVHVIGPGLSAIMTYGGTAFASSGMIVVGSNAAGAAVPVSGFSISDMTLDGANLITALRITNCTNCTATHIMAKNGPPDGVPTGGTGNSPLAVDLSNDVIIRDSFISGGRGDFGDGIYFDGCVRCQSVNNHVSDITRIGIVFEQNGTTKSVDAYAAGNTINNEHDASGGQSNGCVWAENTNSGHIIDNRCSNAADIVNIIGNGTTATAFLFTAFTFPNTSVTISGNSQAGFNGTFTITVVSPTQFTFSSATNATGVGGFAANAPIANVGVTLGPGASNTLTMFVLDGNRIREHQTGYVLQGSTNEEVLISNGDIIKGGTSSYNTGVSILGGRSIKIKGMHFGDNTYGASGGAIVVNANNNIDFLSIEDCSIGTMTQVSNSADLLLFSMNGNTLSDLSVRGLTGAAAWTYGDSGGTGTYTRFTIANSFLNLTPRFGTFKGAMLSTHDSNGALNLTSGGTNQNVVITPSGTGQVLIGDGGAGGASATPNVEANSTATLGADVGAMLGLGGNYTGTTPTPFAMLQGAKDNSTDGNFGGYFRIFTRANGGSYQEQMRIASNGMASFSSNRVVMTADWTCGTGGTVSSCTAATIIGSGGGTPLTLTLPLQSASWHWQCDGVVSETTGVTANNWNMITATNGATNVTASYMMGTAAATGGFGATTDQGSTTTTFGIGGTWTLGAASTKFPFHIEGAIEGASASGTVVSLQVIDPTVGDLLTIYRGAACSVSSF